MNNKFKYRGCLKFYLALFMFIFILSACQSTKKNVWLGQIQNQVSRLQDSLRLMKYEYHPGFDDLMTKMQLDHAKLWFAGINSNWALAYYELSEIRKAAGKTENLDEYNPAARDLPVISPSLDSILSAIALENLSMFKKYYILLTNTCNSCHKKENSSFIMISLPKLPPVTDQDFKSKVQ